MVVLLGVAVGLIVAGLVICWLSSQAHYPLLARIFFWVGLVLAVVGVVLLLAPALNWLSVQLRAMLAV